MFELLWMLLTYNINNSFELFDLGVIIHNNLIIESSPDSYFPVIYSLITGQGDCYNLASMYNFALNIRGINNYLLKIDTNSDDINDHAIIIINDSRFGCFSYDLINLNYSNNFCSE
jgi:hypothetical protein